MPRAWLGSSAVKPRQPVSPSNNVTVASPYFLEVLGLGFEIMKYCCISEWFSIPFGSGSGYSQLGEVHFNPHKTRAGFVQVVIVLL